MTLGTGGKQHIPRPPSYRLGEPAPWQDVPPEMRRQHSGHVINISSIGGYASHEGWGVYCATKFAVEGITEALSAELAPLGIRATVVEPGFFRTDFLDDQSLVKTKNRIASRIPHTIR